MTAEQFTSSADRSSAPAGAMRRYLLTLLLGGLLALLLLLGLFALLAHQGRLGPPQISNNLCLDEKLGFMRAHPPQDPNLLVVGSSVAWRHFNSPEAVRLDPALRPYNAGLCGTNVAQTRRVTSWLMARLPSVRKVVLIASPRDFADCSPTASSNFDTEAADRFVFERASPVSFYKRYFDPGTLLFNSIGLRSRRSDPTSFESLVINAYGDGPLEPPQARGLFYGEASFDPGCFTALRRLAQVVGGRRVPLTVALTPLHPGWSERFDPNGSSQRLLERGTRNALAGTGARFLTSPALPEEAFFDAIHLRWSRTPSFTRGLLSSMIVRPVPG
jgi:hypothetical protein